MQSNAGFLDRHYICQSYDPCLVLMPTFMGKNHHSSFFLFASFFFSFFPFVVFASISDNPVSIYDGPGRIPTDPDSCASHSASLIS